MDPSKIKPILVSLVPFITTVGLELDEVTVGAATGHLTSRREVHNHIGTVHTGAVYSLGESVSGAVVLSMFADLMPKVFIALKSATMVHTKARPGDVYATATLDRAPAEIRADYDTQGKVDFNVNLSYTVEGTEVASTVFVWAIRAPR